MSVSSVVALLLHQSLPVFLDDSDKKTVKNGPAVNRIILVMCCKMGTQRNPGVWVTLSLPSHSSSIPAAAAGGCEPAALCRKFVAQRRVSSPAVFLLCARDFALASGHGDTRFRFGGR